MAELITDFGTMIDRNNVLSEYPRPQLKRDSYINLNGEYECAFSDSADFPKLYPYKILVPFSPESALSGVGRTLKPKEFLFYRRTLKLKKDFNRGLIFLHFGAVDQICEVFIDGNSVGSHEGGFLPFSLDITKEVEGKDSFELIVRVQDFTDTSFYSRGKQRLKHGQIWYTPQSGIWQSVWLESVPTKYIKSIKLTPDFDEAQINIKIEHNLDTAPLVTIFDEGKVIASVNSSEAQIKIESFKEWRCESPFLYDVKIEGGKDSVESYFGMRKVSLGVHNGNKCIMLNNRPVFNNGLLDQGYYPDGLLTPPSDEALSFDIMTAKSMGFNVLRKHIKIEPLRWYYHCDRLGMLVWQDMVNGGTSYSPFVTQILPFTGFNSLKDNKYKRFSRADIKGREQFYNETDSTIELLYNNPCIIVWVPFNEGWGQFDAEKMYSFVKLRDNTRLIDHASGWHDQRCGDFFSRHIYFVKLKKHKDPKNRAFAITEFGGYSHYVKNHSYSDRVFGYKRFSKIEDLYKAYESLYINEVMPLIKKGLCASIYTQLTDVEDEVNGLITYDRKVIKISETKLKELNEKLNEAFLAT